MEQITIRFTNLDGNSEELVNRFMQHWEHDRNALRDFQAQVNGKKYERHSLTGRLERVSEFTEQLVIK